MVKNGEWPGTGYEGLVAEPYNHRPVDAIPDEAGGEQRNLPLPTPSSSTRELLRDMLDEGQIYISAAGFREQDQDIQEAIGGKVSHAAKLVMDELGLLPESLLKVLRDGDFSLKIVDRAPNSLTSGRLLPGVFDRRNGVAYVRFESLAFSQGVVLEEALHAVDQLLGGGGLDDAISAGNYKHNSLKALAREVQGLFKDELNHFSGYAAKNSKEFLAHAVLNYLDTSTHDILRTAYPKVYALVKEKILNESYWQEVLLC